ncbi:MAG: 16S rRNA (cytosine(1402)-N(4))-methyltransferase RsmH, partial [Erysipelotrichaceae bacterium]|nr:16S rRNA (cytosine(1402)-N(4))-methyltransferase RsmH [Erysipelotrichaceae bacterium]
MMEHYSVLLNEAIEGLNIRPEGIYVDGTLGRGGHSSEILKRLSTGHLYSFDIDDEAFEYSRQRLSQISDKFTLIKANFADMKEELENRGIYGVDGILLDIGVSSPQFDEADRGFSYRFEDSRLDMRMDRTQSLDARKVVNEYDYSDLVRIFYKYGEESYAKQIARKIEAERAKAPIETTGQLVDIIRSALPAKVVSK